MVCLLAPIVGCTREPPQLAAANYLQSLKDHDYLACYRMLSREDKAQRTFDQFLTEIPLAPDVGRRWFKAVLRRTRYKVANDIVREKMNVIVPVKVKAPNLQLWERTLDAIAGDGSAPAPAISDSLKASNYPTVSYTDEIVMVWQNHRWRLVADFPARERAAEIRRRALELYYHGDYDRAAALYRSAIDEIGRHESAGARGLRLSYQREIDEMALAGPQEANRRSYLGKIRLSGVSVKMSASHEPALFGELFNAGSAPLDQLTLTATYFDGRGKRHRELDRERHVIVFAPLQFTDFTSAARPLLPGETQEFGFPIKAPKSILAKADPYVSVESVVFTPSALRLPLSSAKSGRRGETHGAKIAGAGTQRSESREGMPPHSASP
jgi:hypothetical protein